MIYQEKFDAEKYKSILLQTFKSFIEICNQYQLRYFCAGGTVLGAVRHNGFIPWDDDIDVFMPADDYYKFIELNSQISPKGYSVISVNNTKSFATFAKFYDNNTTLWEFKEIPFIYGVYIDIFPLYESSDDLGTFLKKYKKMRNAQRFYQLSQMRFSLGDILTYFKSNDKKYFYKGVLSLCFPRFMSPWYRKRLLKMENVFKGQKGAHMVCPYGEYFAKEYQQKSWYDSYSDHVFCDLMARLPSDYDAFLRHVYGDYMKLPPKEKQKSHHYHYYLNMDRRMTIEEVRNIIESKSI